MANHPNVYLAKFEDVQNMKVKQILKHPFILQALVACFGEFLLNSEFMTEIFFNFFFTKWRKLQRCLGFAAQNFC